jgi:DNA-binding CsgD family transcriptional regulator/catechol 2,3-dioxygenase-like lactoylglutathione lyase family enzyme
VRTVKKRPGRPPHPDILTLAEWRVVEAVRHGLTNRQIAIRQDVSIDAVKYHVTNALQKLDLSSRAQLRLWSGIRRDSRLFDKEITMTDSPALGPLAQISRNVADVLAARRWYEDVLGLSHLYSFPGMAFFDCGGVRLYLTQHEGRTDETVLYFRVDDIRSAHEALMARGVEFINAPHRIHRNEDGTEEWLSMFHDNERRPLAIMARVSA